MTPISWQQAMTTIRQHPQVRWGAGADEKMISAAENALEVHFPLSYRQYLRSIGWCDVGSDELYGLDSDLPHAYRNVVEATQAEREAIGLPKSLVVICQNSWGNLICLQTDETEGSECPVVFVRLCPKPDMRTLASCFSEFVVACVAYGVDDLTEPLYEWRVGELPHHESTEPMSWQDHRRLHREEALQIFDAYRLSRRWLRRWYDSANPPWLLDRWALEREARWFLLSHSWCQSVCSLTVRRYVEGIFGLFWAEIEPAPQSDADSFLWVVVGDLPPAYLDTSSLATPEEALEAYIALMGDWVSAVGKGGDIDEHIPVYYRCSFVPTPPVQSYAQSLEKRLRILGEMMRSWG